MIVGPELLLIGAVATVGVLHTIVPDHWVPIALIARQRGWSKVETARAALLAGIGHVLSTLLIGSVVWLAGVVAAARFGHVVDTAASTALVAFGGWIAISAWRELRGSAGHAHGHGHGHNHAHDFAPLGGAGIHGPELQRIPTELGELELSIYEAGGPAAFSSDRGPCRRGQGGDAASRWSASGLPVREPCTYWESIEQIPEPHAFDVMIAVERGGHAHTYETEFAEHGHRHGEVHGYGHGHEREPVDDPLYAPLRGDTAVLTRHVHVHRHGRGAAHGHWHDHIPETAHLVTASLEAEPPLHVHRHKTSARTALLLILGSSPMVEGIPAFFAAGKYGIGLIIALSAVFAISTIATYVLLCVYSTAGLQRARLGAFERYGEVLSGAFIAVIGMAFWIWPVL
jgi:hypothetical protein